MKRGLKQKSCIFLVMALVFFTGKAALAESHSPFEQCDTPVTGIICLIPDDGSYIKISENNDCSDADSVVVVYGIPFYYLLRVHGLDLAVDQEVQILVHECPTANPEGRLKACVVNGITVFPPGEREPPASADVNGDQGNYGQGRF